jgi:hypothetical protein
MREVQLYIEGQRVDLFKDETISVTQSIQNVKDIAKVFTDFSKTFTLPASKANNKIFKHYYNYDIANTFDARIKVAAEIKLNYVTFKKGYIKLEGVNLKDNKPNIYRITFFGDIVDLKDKLGEKKLSDLDFNAYQPLNYDSATIESKLTTTQSSSQHIIVPLITHSQRLYYDSGSHDTAGDGNLYYDTGHTQNLHGVKWNELKYAIRVNKIIEQIETDFGLTFSSDFFKNTSIEEFDHLFLWLHRKSGAVEDLSGSTLTFETIIDGWTPITVSKTGYIGGYNTVTFTLTESTLTSNVATFGTTSSGATQSGLGIFRVVLETTDTDEYNITLLRDGTAVFNKAEHIGNITISGDPNDANNFVYAAGTYELVITATSQISFSNIYWDCTYYFPKTTDVILNSSNASTGAYNTNSSFTFNINKQIPDIKIIDFLTGLFKLFNLTAYAVDGVIQVKPLNDYYENPNIYDITRFVDTKASKVDAALPYKEVSFKFKDTGSFLANKFGELNNRKWGSMSYNEGQNLASGTYNVEVPFGHILYERLIDQNTGTQTTIQWGYSVDNSQNPYLGSPLLFYVNRKYAPISFIDEVDNENKGISHKQLVWVNQPFNAVGSDIISNPFQFNFNREINEWSGDSDHTETLFVKYYQDYIKRVFNDKQRLTKLTAYLPLKILLNFNLSDRFVVNGKRYFINNIDTNLQTGESQIELLNDI